MRCIERIAKLSLLGVAALAAGCSSPAPAPAPATARPTTKTLAAPPATAATSGKLPAPGAVRSWSEVRLQAARRIVAANPAGTYMGTPPDVLLAIPVLEIELNGDGSVRRIVVLRPPRQAKDTIEIAAEAVRRAAPFGDVSRLPRPWKFVETFLFDDDRRFKPRTLD